MFQIKALLVLTVTLHLAQSQPWMLSCRRKALACKNRKEGKVCGYDPVENKYKVFDSLCALFTEACSNFRDIALFEMKKCKENKKKGRTKSESTGGAVKPPTDVFVRPGKTIVSEGADVEIVCFATGPSPVEFLWEVLPEIDPGANPGEIPKKIKFKLKTSTLTLKKITKEKTGTYTCTAYNEAGSLSASATIDVQYPPTVKVTPTYTSIKLGQRAEFDCTATGNPVPSITWKKDGSDVSNSNSLLITRAGLNDHGTYQCVASNSEASRSAEITLNVEVDGGWSGESCTKCGRNPYNNNKCQKKCERKCTNPSPQNGGARCPGDSEFARDCDKSNCKVPNHKKDCFPGRSRVTLPNGASKFMQDLNIGDAVLTVTYDNKIVSSKVLTLLHKEVNTSTTYMNIETDEQTLSISPNHLMFVSEDGNADNVQAMFASKVQKGMYLKEAKLGQIRLVPVKSISRSTMIGKYAPLTEHGTILVDNLMTSCYAVINSHWLAHVGLSPLRWYYMYMGLVHDDVPKEDIHWYPTLLNPMLAVLPQS